MSIQTIKKEVSKLNKQEQAELDKREAALNSGAALGKPAREVIAKYR